VEEQATTAYISHEISGNNIAVNSGRNPDL
jgi:hypothetical protein